MAFAISSSFIPRALSSASIIRRVRSSSERMMMSPLTLAMISSTTPMSAAERDAARARDAQTIRNFIYEYCSNYTGRRRRARRLWSGAPFHLIVIPGSDTGLEGKWLRAGAASGTIDSASDPGEAGAKGCRRRRQAGLAFAAKRVMCAGIRAVCLGVCG